MLSRKIMCIGCAAAMLIGVSGASVMAEETGNTVHKIGVVVYDTQNSEVQMFRQYYKEYIESCFPVEFVYSSNVFDWNDEKEYLDFAVENDVEGIISFNATNLPETMKICEENEMYYMLGSGSIAPAVFDEVKENEWFLGTFGPDEEMEYHGGADMAENFAAKDEEKSAQYVILTGGAALGNYMHEVRARGMLEALQEVYGYQYEKSIEDMVFAEEPMLINTGKGTVLGIFPGYLNQGEQEEIQSHFAAFLEQMDVSAVMSVIPVDPVVGCMKEKEKQQKSNILVGIVDCFSLQNYTLFEQKDGAGSHTLDYVAGKYGSIIGPAFAAMFNAVNGDVDMLRTKNGAFQLVQGFWVADGREAYKQLFGLTQGSVANAYSNEDLMPVIRAYNPDADFEDLKELTEAWDVDAVCERMGIK